MAISALILSFLSKNGGKNWVQTTAVYIEQVKELYLRNHST